MHYKVGGWGGGGMDGGGCLDHELDLLGVAAVLRAVEGVRADGGGVQEDPTAPYVCQLQGKFKSVTLPGVQEDPTAPYVCQLQGKLKSVTLSGVRSNGGGNRKTPQLH